MTDRDEICEVWVAVRLPWPDGSGQVKVLGVHDTEDGAAAMCWRDQRWTENQPTEVAAVVLNDSAVQADD